MSEQSAQAVRSIRIATTLSDRFRVLLATGHQNTAALELAIGEAQQIYPEIWRHLGDARRVLVTLDRDVSQFDDLARNARKDLGVTDVEAQTSFDYGGLLFGEIGFTEFKAAAFNRDGYQHAVAAGKALMDAMPEIDWKAVAAEEQREIDAAGSLQAAKWIGIVKWAAIAGALVLVIILVVRFATRPATHEANPGRERENLREGELGASARELQQTLGKISRLKADYAESCSRDIAIQLATIYRTERRIAEAEQIEKGQCVPKRPQCDQLRDNLRARLEKRFEASDRDLVVLACEGMIAGKPNAFVPALAVAFHGKKKDGEKIAQRAILSADGERELVAFAWSPEDSNLSGVGDLDGDSVDELVMTGERGFIVSRLDGSGLVDILGPTLSCPAVANLERDLREDPNSKQRRVVVTVAETEKPAKGCPGPGRHFYKLDAGKVVED